MKLASYRTSKGAGYGVVTGDGIVDLTRRIGRKFPDLRALLAGGALAQAEKIAKAAKKADLKASKVNFLPVIPNPGKIVCVGLNYEEHRMETGRDKTENPALFIPRRRVAGRPQAGYRHAARIDQPRLRGRDRGDHRKVRTAHLQENPGSTSRATPATTTARCATGSATPCSGPRARTSAAPADSARGWSRAARSRTARN